MLLVSFGLQDLLGPQIAIGSSPPASPSAGKRMRSKEDVLKDWPEPQQPGELASPLELFAESSVGEVGAELPSERLIVQL